MSILYSREEIRELEKLAIAHGISQRELMNRAGKAAFNALQDVYPDAESILILCGGGNNGGDGYVLARLAHKAGLKVHVRSVTPLEKLQGASLLAFQACEKAGATVKDWNYDEALAVDLIVDAMVGIGLKNKLKADMQELVEAVNFTGVPILSIDIPSGLIADTGEVAGAAIKATHTVTFLGIKKGMLTGYGPDHVGLLFCHDLDIPADLFEQVSHDAVAINMDVFNACLGARSRNISKADMGHVLVVAGAPGMAGAAKLTALGAARVGAGLISVATHPDHASFLAINQPELMCHAVKTMTQLKVLLKKATVVVIGPGLGRSDWAKRLLKTVLASDLPLVMDADALNLLADKPSKRSNWVLTPHPGEAARLLKSTSQKIQKDRYGSVKALQKKFHGTVVLKGCGSLICDGSETLLCYAGNSGMASGGMGDLLSGVIAGLIAQAVDPSFAASLGTVLHSSAADAVAEKQGERGMLATDLLPFIKQLVNTL